MRSGTAKAGASGQIRHAIAGALAIGILFAPEAQAQQATCPNPAMEQRLHNGLVRNGPSIGRQLTPARLQSYAACHIRIVCNSGLDRTEFEMYAIDTLASFGDAQAEREKASRWSRDGRKHQSAMDKVPPPNRIDAQCLGNAR